MSRSPTYQTLTKVQGMIAYVRENLSDDDFNLFLDMLVPEPEVKTVKRGRKKATKSKRAESLSKQIQTASRTIVGAACGICGNIEEHPDHDTGHYLSAHPFAPPASSAKKRSSRKDATTGSTVSSETGQDVAVAVAGGFK